MSAVRLAVLFAALWQAILAATPAWADDNRPLTITIAALSARDYRLVWKIPANVEVSHVPALSAGPACATKGLARNWSDPMGHWREEAWRCTAGLAGRQIRIAYPFANPNLATIVRYQDRPGSEPETLLLQPQQSRFAPPSAGEPARGGILGFLILGIKHIWLGFDHLLFVAGLIFIAGTPRRILATITGFTAAHSVTLALAALDLVRLPIAAVEAVIALSIVFLAVEVVKGPRNTLTWRKPVVVASAFGLLHGFGFAAVLKEIGLPTDGVVVSLLAFNTGIEIGQVIFAGLVVLALRAISRLANKGWDVASAGRGAGFGIGVLASFWMFERLLG